MSRRVLCFGDSNTYGYDPRPYLGGRYPEHVRWTGRLKAAGWEVLNAGENGRTIPRLEWETEHAARTIRSTNAELLTVMLGTNDLLQRPGLTAELCARRMDAFLSALLTAFTAPVQTLLVAPPPVEPGPWAEDPRLWKESRRLGACYQALAGRLGVSFADAGSWSVALAFDGVHFSEPGHETFGTHMDRALKALCRGH